MGAKSTLVTVTSDGAPSTLTFNLTGTGVQPNATVTPSSKAFGSVINGAHSSGFAFTVTNDGTAPLNVTNVTLGGANPSQFDIVSQDCVSSSPIAFPAGTCTINVRFSPTSLGVKHATIVIASDAGASTAPTVSGTGISNNPGSITIKLNSVPNSATDFGWGGDLGTFSLDDDADGTLPNQQAFPGLTAGVYTVAQNHVNGWVLVSIVCDQSGVVSSVSNRVAQMDALAPARTSPVPSRMPSRSPTR